MLYKYNNILPNVMTYDIPMLYTSRHVPIIYTIHAIVVSLYNIPVTVLRPLYYSS